MCNNNELSCICVGRKIICGSSDYPALLVLLLSLLSMDACNAWNHLLYGILVTISIIFIVLSSDVQIAEKRCIVFKLALFCWWPLFSVCDRYVRVHGKRKCTANRFGSCCTNEPWQFSLSALALCTQTIHTTRPNASNDYRFCLRTAFDLWLHSSLVHILLSYNLWIAIFRAIIELSIH